MYSDSKRNIILGSFNAALPSRFSNKRLQTIPESLPLSKFSSASTNDLSINESYKKNKTPINTSQTESKKKSSNYENLSYVRFGCLNYFAIAHKSDHKHHKNKLTVILNVQKPNKIQSDK